MAAAIIVLKDYKVRPRDLYEIALEAKTLRNAFPEHVRGRMIDPVGVLKALRRTKRMGKGRLTIKFLPESDMTPGKVSYNPLTLWIRKDIWRTAAFGQKRFEDWLQARWVLLHELGHIALHDDREVIGYTGDHSIRTSLPIEVSAEDQADKLAMFLACPITNSTRSFNIEDLATLHGIPEEVCEEVLAIARTYVEHNEGTLYTRQNCETCHGTMRHKGSYLLCTNCQPEVRIDL